jgi:uncharacterized membrane protein HdeD (DUF308 family)
MTTATATETDVKMTPWWLVLIEGIAAVIVGVLLLADPQRTMVVLIQVLGIYWFIAGIFKIVSMFIDSTMWGWKLFAGILGILAGIIIINHPLWSTVLVQATVVLLLAIDGLIIGIVGLIQAVKGGGWGIGILGVLSMIFGVILLANLWIATFAFSWVLAIFAIIGGILAIIMAFRLR